MGTQLNVDSSVGTTMILLSYLHCFSERFLSQPAASRLDDSRCQDCPQSRFFHGFCHSVFVKVHVGKTSGAAFNHLQTAQQGTSVYVASLQFLFKGPYGFFPPNIEGFVLRDAAKEGHSHMSVTVNQSREGYLSLSI